MRRLVWKVVLIFLLFSAVGAEAAFKAAIDPSEAGVGARPMGMGKTFVGIADDYGAVFMNPAGLGDLKKMQLSSMMTRLVSGAEYNLIGGTYPVDYGTFGVGYVGANIGGGYATVRDSNTNRIVSSTTETSSISYGTQVFLLSYGAPISQIFELEGFENMTVGANLKMYSQRLTGGGITGGDAAGMDIDLAAKYKPVKWFTVGVVGRNFLPAALGGKLTWANGREESIPALIKVGTAYNILGGAEALYPHEHHLKVGLDLDTSVTRNRPLLFHLGTEWWPQENVAFRMGIDQDAVSQAGGSTGVSANLTMGLGLYWDEVQFDYAYHQYENLSENNTHYFSFSYVGPKVLKPPSKKIYLRIVEPEDKSIVYDDFVLVLGQLGAEAKSAEVNGILVKLGSGRIFEAEVPLIGGKNAIKIVAYDEAGKKLAEKTIRVLRLLSFKDVAEGAFAKEKIEQLATLGLVGGYPDGTFKPRRTISRAEMTTLLIRAKAFETPEPKKRIFRDLSIKHWAAKYISVAAKEKIVSGYPDGTFRPNQKINRVEGVIVVSRFAGLLEVEEIYQGPFPDVPIKHWAAKMLTEARDQGLLAYLGFGQSFFPKKPLSRAETVEILSQTKFVGGKIVDLLDWEKGY